MTNLFKCLTCSDIITDEESHLHKCKSKIVKYRTIEATSYFTAQNDHNEKCIVVDALNGIGYTFVIKEPKLIPLEEGLPRLVDAPTRLKQPSETTEDGSVPYFGYCRVERCLFWLLKIGC